MKFLDVVAFIFLCAGLNVGEAAKWSYSGDAGPMYWHELFPHACSGRHQSPIDLRPEQTMYNPDLKDFAIWYDPPKADSKFYIKNNGHTVQVDLEGDFFVTNGGLPHVYKAVQFHFHWGHKAHHGSEHLIEGKASPIEVHIVTYNRDLYADVGEAVTETGGLAVLGVMFEVSEEDNLALESIIKAIKHIRDPETRTRISLPPMSLRDLLPEDISRYYRYNGSLTTPGCFESVRWTVFDKKQTISHAQLKEFRTLMQFRNKHKKHTSNTSDNSDHSEGSRHRRSLSKAQKEMERRAEDVLEELGIKGNHFEETVFKAQLMEKQQREMMGDMPHESHGSHHNTNERDSRYKPTLDEARAAKIDSSIYEHAGHSTDDKYTTTGATTHEEEREIEFTQEILVNNFRPVQPLNNRVVYRSFKLREPAMEPHEAQKHRSFSVDHAPAPSKHGDNGRNTALNLGVSVLSVVTVALLSICYSL